VAFKLRYLDQFEDGPYELHAEQGDVVNKEENYLNLCDHN